MHRDMLPLSADEILWEKVRKNVLDTGIYFDRVRLGGVTLSSIFCFMRQRMFIAEQSISDYRN